MIVRCISFVAALALGAPASFAQTPAGGLAGVELLPGWRTERGTHMAALRIRLEPGWKTYWRSPGDAGIPPQFDWSASRNVSGAATFWPVPEVFDLNGMTSIGYAESVVLPLEISLPHPEATARLTGTVSFGICREICVPQEATVDAVLPASGGTVDGSIAAALADRPMGPGAAELAGIECGFETTAEGTALTARLDMPALGDEEIVVVETSDPGIWVSPAETARNGQVLNARVELVAEDGGPLALGRDELRFTVIGEARAVDVRGCS